MIQYFSYHYEDGWPKLDAVRDYFGIKFQNGIWKDPLSDTYIGCVETNITKNIAEKAITNKGFTLLTTTQVCALVEQYFKDNPPPKDINWKSGSWDVAKVVNGFVVKNPIFI